ncbi:MAG: metallophosphoesterase family protein [Clostridia bacterium]|nr:metallophosphoesterase family protein [Clostridia bacterium]
MKKTFIRILSIVLCLALISGGAAFSSAANLPATNTDAVATNTDAPEATVSDTTPTRISVAVNGDTKSSKGITWYTKANTASIVEITDENGAKVTASVNCADVFEFEGNYVHKATVTGLAAGKNYKFRVGDGTTFSNWGSFVTDNGDSKSEFIVVADIQASNLRNFQAGARVLNAAFENMPGAEYMINLGDFTNDSTNEEWDYYDEALKEINLNTTIAPVAGNHDGLGVWDWFNNMFNLDTTESVQNLNGVNYSFDYGNAHIAVLNTNDLLSVSFAQLNWLRNDMNGTDKDWKIVCMHKSPYTLGKDGKWPDALYLKRALTAVVDECGVDLVMSGHDHQYLRTQPMKYNMVNENGTTYVLAGTAGTKRYGVRNFLEGYMMNTKHIAALTTQNDGHYWDGETHEKENQLYKGGIFNTIAIDGGKLSFNSYVVSDLKEDEEGNIIDENEVPTVTLHDSFTLEKEIGQNEITFTGDNTTSEVEYYLGAVPSFFGLAAYTFIEWLPRVLVMLPELLVDVVFLDGSF